MLRKRPLRAGAAGCTAVGVGGIVPLTATPSRPVISELIEISVSWLRRLPLHQTVSSPLSARSATP